MGYLLTRPIRHTGIVVTVLVSHTTFDSPDAYAMSVIWGRLLEYAEDHDDPNEPGDEECMIFSADGTPPTAVHRGARCQVSQQPDPIRRKPHS